MTSRPLLLHAEGDTRTGLGHLVRMVAIAGELASEYPVLLASASPHAKVVMSELAPWAIGTFELRELRPSPDVPWTRGCELAAELSALALEHRALALISDGKAVFQRGAFTALRGSTPVVVVDNVAADPEAYDLLVLPTCHADPEIVARVGPARVRTGAAWTFLHPAVRALASSPRRPGTGTFVSMGGADPHGLTGRALTALLRRTDGPLVAVVGPANAHRAQLESLAAAEPRVRLVHGSPASQEALAASARAICAFGITAYEAVALGVPLVVLPHDGVIDADIERFVSAFPERVWALRTPDEAETWPAELPQSPAGLGGLGRSLLRLLQSGVR